MKNILVLGDSHATIFNFIKKKKYKTLNFNVVISWGATAQGLVNPNSKTNALVKFKNELEGTNKKYDFIIIMIGEVDCGYLIWYRAKKYNISVEEQTNNSVNNLFNFIKTVLFNIGYHPNQIIVLGSILPTIKDNTDKLFLKGARSEIDIDQQTRTKLTLTYNDLLKEKCLKLNLHYADITKETINETGLIDNKFIRKDKHNHHLSNEFTFKLWINCLEKIVFD